MQAIILCGGLGTRLKSVIKDIPKPMADINGVPFLQILLEFLLRQGVQSVILAVSYKFEVIQDFFKDEFKGLKILYSIEDTPLGTGAAIRQALNLASEKEIFVLNGDTFFDIDLSHLRLLEGSQIALALKKERDFDRYGEVRLDERGFISSFREKEFVKNGLINGGIYKLKKDIFECACELGVKFEEKFSFETFLQAHFKTLKACGVVFKDYFIDIGIPQDLERFRQIKF